MKALLFGFLALLVIITVGIMLAFNLAIKTFKKLRNAADEAQREAVRKAQQHRNETGRQQQQYQYNGHRTQSRTQQTHSSTRQQQQTEQPTERRTQTATGETIIDKRDHTQASRKIFDHDDGEYVDFEEER